MTASAVTVPASMTGRIVATAREAEQLLLRGLAAAGVGIGTDVTAATSALFARRDADAFLHLAWLAPEADLEFAPDPTGQIITLGLSNDDGDSYLDLVLGAAGVAIEFDAVNEHAAVLAEVLDGLAEHAALSA